MPTAPELFTSPGGSTSRGRFGRPLPSRSRSGVVDSRTFLQWTTLRSRYTRLRPAEPVHPGHHPATRGASLHDEQRLRRPCSTTPIAHRVRPRPYCVSGELPNRSPSRMHERRLPLRPPLRSPTPRTRAATSTCVSTPQRNASGSATAAAGSVTNLSLRQLRIFPDGDLCLSSLRRRRWKTAPVGRLRHHPRGRRAPRSCFQHTGRCRSGRTSANLHRVVRRGLHVLHCETGVCQGGSNTTSGDPEQNPSDCPGAALCDLYPTCPSVTRAGAAGITTSQR